MKVVCISCFNHYATRIKGIIDYYKSVNADIYYITSDYQHFEKKYYKAEYDTAIQIHVPSYKRNMSFQRIHSHVVFSKLVMQKLNEIRPDIIYCMFPPNMLVKNVSQYKKKNTDVKIIYDCFDMWPESFPINKRISDYIFAYWRRLRDKYLDASDLLICVSNDMANTLNVLHGNINTKVLKPAVSVTNVPDYNFNIDGGISFLYLGNVNFITDIELGVKLLSLISAKKKTTLHIIGGGQNLEDFVERLRDVGVQVFCHGVIFDEEQKRKVFEKCQLGLNIPKVEIHSTMALKAIEYMHMGLPFLNAGEGDNFSMVQENEIGINIDRTDLNETVKAVTELSNSKLDIMSQKCISYYKDTFANQDIESVLNV